MFSTVRLIRESLWHYRRMHLAVALGVAAGTAVLTGALLVGDSVQASLRSLTLDRLGNIEEALITNSFFREQLAEETQALLQKDHPDAQVIPLMLLRGTVERPGTSAEETTHRAGQIAILGIDDNFFSLGSFTPAESSASAEDEESEEENPLLPAAGEIMLNEAVASELHAEVGDEVLVRLPQMSQIPEESALGKRDDLVETRRLTVSQIVKNEGLGRFGLFPTQRLPRNVYVNLRDLQRSLDLYERRERAGRINALLTDVSITPPTGATPAEEKAILQPTLADYEITLEKTDKDYFLASSKKLLLPNALPSALREIFPTEDRQPVITYLANTIRIGEKEVPYSTVTGIDFQQKPPLGPFENQEGEPLSKLGPDEIVLNTWAAEQLEAKIGDTVEIVYFSPETTHGETEEQTASFKLVGIVPIEGAAADKQLTPEFPGITDQLSIGEWDPPFPFEEDRVRQVDEDYWDEYQATPKAFISLEAGQKLWASRFGDLTSIRLRPKNDEQSVEEITTTLEADLDPAALGFQWQPLKARQLAASSGATPFGVLFLSFSFFLIAAAVMLVALLFRLGVDQRAKEVGIYEATGWALKQIRRTLIGEGLIVAAVGSALGVGIGIGYAALMIWALTSPDLWLAAIQTPFLQLAITPSSLIIGYLAGLLISLVVIFTSVRRLGKVNVRSLLGGQIDSASELTTKPARFSWWLGVACFLGAILLLPLGFFLTEMAQAGVFFGSGAFILTACLAYLWNRLRSGAMGNLATSQGGMLQLAARNSARNPWRSVLTMGLVASATFLIVAISAFHLDPSLQGPQLDSGNGGFRLVGQSDLPILTDLNSYDTSEGQLDLALTKAQSEELSGTKVYSFRVEPGDDSSCLNLYQTNQPRILGVTERFIERGGFAWAGSAAETPRATKNPWLLLDQELPQSDTEHQVIPAVLDAATATYGLKIGIGDHLTVQDSFGRPLDLQVVGLLSNSLLQGDMLISEKDFLRYFPNRSGYQFFLLETPAKKMKIVSSILEDRLGEQGLDLQPASQRLAEFLAVQNTYLKTFQSLGGLGLLLGTFGLATVQLRNVFERRGELALLRATGFRRSRLATMVLSENFLLLLGGLVIGLLAALVAILPHLLRGAANLPIEMTGATLLLVVVVGMLAGLGAVRKTLSTPLLPALRSE
ncbi:ABC-type antimicrobial peptide transport system, permease component [Planctomycetales bacterium 10988]|nr:ABC-type antimicrobial peptide transport system, permease component [Planctomycetales bacterium 10988]